MSQCEVLSLGLLSLNHWLMWHFKVPGAPCFNLGDSHLQTPAQWHQLGLCYHWLLCPVMPSSQVLLQEHAPRYLLHADLHLRVVSRKSNLGLRTGGGPSNNSIMGLGGAQRWVMRAPGILQQCIVHRREGVSGDGGRNARRGAIVSVISEVQRYILVIAPGN